jgi:hypothetical protein
MSIIHYLIPSVPVKVTPLHNYASTEDDRSITPTHLQPGTRRWWVAIYPWERSSTICTEHWVGLLRTSLDGMENLTPTRIWSLDRPACGKSLTYYVILAANFLKSEIFCAFYLSHMQMICHQSYLWCIWNNIKFKYKYRSQGDFPCSELFTSREVRSTHMLNTISAYHH